MSTKAFVRVSIVASVYCVTCCAEAPQAQAAKAANQVTWAGTVYDDQGSIVAGTEVFIIADYGGVRHASKYLLSAVSNARGSWSADLELTPEEFKQQHCQNVLVFWHQAGCCSDFRHIPYLFHDASKNRAGQPSPGDLRLVVPSGKATLSVTAVRDGVPVADAIVRIANEQWPTLFNPELIEHAAGAKAGAGMRLGKLLDPTARTDNQGVARFDDLAPGTYRILAAQRDHEQLYDVQLDPLRAMPVPIHEGVPLRAGEDRRFTVAVYERSNRAPLQVLQSDGVPASWETTVYEYFHGAGFVDGGSGSGGWIDEEGRAQIAFGRPGLWRMYVRKRELDWVTKVDPPCYEAAGVLAVSPLLENAPATVLKSRWIERDEMPRPGRARDSRNANLSDIAGRVVYADGKTPSFGVKLIALDPRSGRVVHRGRSDALGRFQAKVCNTAADRAVLSNVPAMLAMLPGECGATIVPVAALEPRRELKITLPKAMSLRGRVTVGGGNASKWTSQFHVLAAFEGGEKLDEQLSIRVSPDPLGSFELRGLTPGRYRVQASMDDIWLSASVLFIVDADGVRSEPLTLDIGQPGVPSVVRCIDRSGKPVVGIQVELKRPAGPLAKTLWPARFTTDGAGVLNLPPLEAGDHLLSVQSPLDPTKRSEHKFTVAKLTASIRPMRFDLIIE